jgi:hypothetical protein
MWQSSDASMRSHVCVKHGFVADDVKEGLHYGDADERAAHIAQRDRDIEDAAGGFRNWLDSLGGADDFVTDAGGV